MSATTVEQPLLAFACVACGSEPCYLETDTCEACLWSSVQAQPEMQELRELEQRGRRHRLAEI